MIRQNTHIEPDWGIDIGVAPLFELRIVEERPEGLFALGVAHSTIKLRQNLQSLRLFEAQALPDPQQGDHLLAVNLRVMSIQAYHNRLNRVLTGMTASLILSGDSQALIAVLQSHGWEAVDGQYHQWQESVLTPKFILTT